MNPIPFLPGRLSFAEQLALQHFPRGRVDPEAIARACGVTVLHTGFQDEIDGFLLNEAGREVIVVNDRRAPQGSDRARFTIAHELGHRFLRSPDELPPFVAARVPGPPSPEEQAADRFAAHLLMPGPSFLAAQASVTVAGLAGVSLLATAFGTSLTATAYRSLALGLFPDPCAILLWQPSGRRCGRRLSPRTWCLGDAFRPLAATPPADSPSASALESLAVGLKQGSMPARSWFTGLDGREPEHHRCLNEEVHSRGSHGWITLLHAA